MPWILGSCTSWRIQTWRNLVPCFHWNLLPFLYICMPNDQHTTLYHRALHGRLFFFLQVSTKNMFYSSEASRSEWVLAGHLEVLQHGQMEMGASLISALPTINQTQVQNFIYSFHYSTCGAWSAVVKHSIISECSRNFVGTIFHQISL